MPIVLELAVAEFCMRSIALESFEPTVLHSLAATARRPFSFCNHFTIGESLIPRFPSSSVVHLQELLLPLSITTVLP